MLRLDEFFLVRFFYLFYYFFIPKRLIYVRIYSFLKKLIHSLQFGFRQNCSTTHTLIHLKNRIKKKTDKCSYAFEVFVDFKKNKFRLNKIRGVLQQFQTYQHSFAGSEPRCYYFFFFFFFDPSSFKLTYIKENIS